MRDLKARLAAYERRLILTTLARAGGCQRRAAEALGVKPTTLHEKLKRLGIGFGRSVEALDQSEERNRVIAALSRCDGQVDQGAALLGLSPRQLRDALRRLGIVRLRSLVDLRQARYDHGS